MKKQRQRHRFRNIMAERQKHRKAERRRYIGNRLRERKTNAQRYQNTQAETDSLALIAFRIHLKQYG